MLVKKVLLYKVAFKVRLAGSTKKKKKKAKKNLPLAFVMIFKNIQNNAISELHLFWLVALMPVVMM